MSTSTRTPARTPSNRSPIRKARAGITLAQKAQLIDNLQQEVTERARRLRQQYSAQAQDLRIRIERRVTRIPTHLRRANMGELLRKYNELNSRSVNTRNAASKSPVRKSPSKNVLQESRYARQSPAPSQRTANRHSNAISATDKENENIENPKKRPVVPARTTSRANNHGPQILSPKSSNTRSPMRPATSPTKSYLARPISPGKPTAGAAGLLNSMVEKAKSTRSGATRKGAELASSTSSAPAGTSHAPTGRGKRTVQTAAATKAGRGRVSDSSETSTGTMVVRKAAAPVKKAPAKRTVMSTIKGIGGQAAKKAAAAKPAPATGTRVLRKRN
ncbi:hypothetical protein PVAG01_10636 [Phlyctema vagabunda]|uniref:Borealin N-terminal domain-containing protein n=1 Tax=Phlyctema vagabunda TaxID=108571 RepID=A0ABR4P2X3_9HELO